MLKRSAWSSSQRPRFCASSAGLDRSASVSVGPLGTMRAINASRPPLTKYCCTA